MGYQLHITRFRKSRRAKDRSNPLGTIGFLLAALLSILVSVGVIYGASRYAEISRGLPSPAELEILLDPLDGSLLEPTRILDRSGEQVLWTFENPAIEFRRYTAITDGEILFYSEIPEEMILATLAAIDPGYMQRPVSFLASILAGGDDPLPKILVADLLLWEELAHPYYELRLNLLANQVVAAYGREKILEWHLNSVYFGNQIYGVAQAAEYYFGKNIRDLDLGESALLAAVAKYPALNPQDAPVAARENQAEVLERMAEAGFISSSEADRAARARLIYADPEPENSLPRPLYVSYLLEEANRTIPLDRLMRGGFRIISTLDGYLQEALFCTLDVMAQRIYESDPQLGTGCESARLLPRYSGPYLDESEFLEMDLIVYDPLNGELLGMVGYSGNEEPPSLENPRDPGSLITPFLYLDAFRQGFEPASLVWDIPLPDSDYSAADLHPLSEDEGQFLGPVNIRTALINDLLSPALQLLDRQGLPQLLNTLELFGFTLNGEDRPAVSSVLELPDLEMIDLVQGYGVFVNNGFLKGRSADQLGLEIQPAVIQQIEDLAGMITPLDDPPLEKKIISEELAYLVNHVLSDQDTWLDPKIADIFRIGRPVGVKTGYVQGGYEGWVIGYTPQIVVGAWTAGSGLDTVEVSSGLWRAVTQHVSRGQSADDWERPSGVISEDVCYPSGNLPTEYCPRIVREVFIQGNEPHGLDGLYQALEVNRETGLLATVFTPAGQIEERVYLNVPTLAASWAAAAGVDTPPVLYDLGISDQEDSALRITSPENLSFVRGRVRVRGAIPAAGFVSARLQYGVGLNPRSWLQIGEDITTPTVGRTLGFWDTIQLEEGIYALQLVVIQENQEIEKSSLILSVDNTAPDMILITDLSEGEVPYQAGTDLFLEVRFPNPSEIEVVEFIVDDELLASRRVAPYIIPWRLALGTHTLEVRAKDQAGNQTELNLDFSVVRE